MQEFRRILVGLDLERSACADGARAGARVQPGSARAAEQALWLARRTGSELLFYHSTWREGVAPSAAPQPLPAALERFVAGLDARGLVLRTACDGEAPWISISGSPSALPPPPTQPD